MLLTATVAAASFEDVTTVGTLKNGLENVIIVSTGLLGPETETLKEPLSYST